MADEHVATYLNDHLAGSVAALELLDHLEAAHPDGKLGDFFKRLRAEVAADRGQLEELMRRLGVHESRARKASAWLVQKMTELKLRFDDPGGGSLLLFESLEALSLGIEGKQSLWIALEAAAEQSPVLRVADYEQLRRRAQEQRTQVEKLRIETARVVLTFDQLDRTKES